MCKEVILFYKPEKEYGCFSNWYKCTFVYNGITYTSSEQYMMHQKALLFRDFEIAEKILKESDQLTIKRLGREVKNYNDLGWKSKREEIMFKGLCEKFKQNEDLLEILLGTGNAIIAEAAPRDVIWGTGKGMQCKDPSLWRGQNLLGKILMRVRDEVGAH